MSYGLGVDLGTTFAAAAVWRSDDVEVVRLGARRAEVPSVVFLAADGSRSRSAPASKASR
jgi:molecular chaperone DnaK (HSP70)